MKNTIKTLTTCILLAAPLLFAMDNHLAPCLLNQAAATYDGTTVAATADLDLTGDLTVSGDPATGVGVGNRDYNDARYAIPPKNKIAIFGDSITAQNGATIEDPEVAGINHYANFARGYFNWARGFAMQPMMLVTNAGVGSETLSNMYERITDVTESDADIVIVAGGRNDMSGLGWPSSYDNATNWCSQIITDIQATGKKVLLTTVTPRTVETDSEVQSQAREMYNRWVLKTAPETFPGLAVVNIDRVLTNPLMGGSVSNVLSDTTHPSFMGAALIGQQIGTALADMLEPGEYEWYGTSNALGVFGNAEMMGGTNWNNYGAASVVYTNYTSNLYGNESAIITVTNWDANGAYIWDEEDIANGRFATNDQVMARADIEWDITEAVGSAQSFYPLVRMRGRRADLSYDDNYIAFYSGSVNNREPIHYPRKGRGIFETPVYTVDGTGSPVAYIYAYFGFYGIQTGTITIHNVSVFKSDIQ